MNRTIINTIFILCKSTAKKSKNFFYKKNPVFLKYILTSLSIVLICACASFGTEDYKGGKKIEANGYQEEKNKDTEFKKIWESFSNEKVFDIDMQGYTAVGNKNAPVVIIEFFDFLCPYCKTVSDILDKAAANNPDKVRLIYANYPLDNECNAFVRRKKYQGACLLAKGAICASEQNKFATYHKLAFNIKNLPIDLNGIKRLAIKANLDADKFQNCLKSAITETALQLQIMEAMKLDIPGTPTIFINGKEYKHKIDKEVIQKIINKEAQRVK